MLKLPPDLQGIAEALDAADIRAIELAGPLDDEEFLWQPDEGRRWSVALCLDHLAVANSVYGEAMAGAIAEARTRGWTRQGPAVPGFFGRQFARSLEPPVRIRSAAPGKIRPLPSRSRDAIMHAYQDAHDRIRQLLQEAAAIDANRATFTNPFLSFVRVRVATGFHVICAHDRRHLWQAEQVVRELRRRAET